jgi:hydroxymethylbilane synthase
MRIGTRGSALALAQAESVAQLLGGAEIEVIRTSGDGARSEAAAGTRRDGGDGARSEAAAGARRDGGDGARSEAAAGTRRDGDGARSEAAAGARRDGGDGARSEPAARAGDDGDDDVEAAAPSPPPADKSRWVDAIERALLDGTIDLAVHSAKDLPGELPDGLALLATVSRAPAQDMLCGAQDLSELASGARVGTSSLRRRAQLLAMRPDVEVVRLAGNVDTRLTRLGEGADSLHAIVLARAGLARLGLEQRVVATPLPLERFVPSPGQGALALEGRAGDERVAAAVAAICDEPALACLRAERSLALAIGADCHTPFGAYAWDAGDGALMLRGWTGLPDGSEWILDEVAADRRQTPEELGALVAERMRSVGAGEMLAAAEATAG